jgi:hypothetical protein
MRQSPETTEAVRLSWEIEEFAQEPGHELFGELRMAMSRLIGTGAADGLQEAYDLALAVSPHLLWRH